jgi:flagellar M-ring protein FliF
MQDNIRRTLAPYLGVGNFEISVATQLNTDKTSTNETIFNPDQRVERSVRSVRESENAQNRNSQRPTSAQENLPDQRTRSDGNDQSSNESSKKEDLTNYEISQKTVQTVSDGYAIRRLSVAVLVNRSRLTALAGPDDKASLDKQIAEIEELVGSAAGFSKERGDTIKVAAVGFVNDGQPMEPVPPLSLTDVMMKQSGTLINAATILVVAGLLIWFGLRPALRAILATPETAQSEVAALAGPEGAPALAADGTMALAAPGAALPGSGEAAKLPSPGVAGLLEELEDKMARSPQKRLEQLIDIDEEQVAAVLKRWLMREEAA